MLENKYKEAIEKAESLINGDLIDSDGSISDPFKKDYYMRYQFVRKINIEKAWIRFYIKANRSFFIYVLSAAATLLFAIFILNDTTRESNEIAEYEIMPAEGAVTLRLSSGSLISVDSDNIASGLLDGVSLDEGTNVITYQPSLLADQNMESKPNKGIPLEAEVHELRIPKGRTFSLVMNDGTKIWLNSESSIRYPVAFSGQSRVVFLEGEAFFDVVADPNSTFTVKTLDYDVHVVGTRFNVKSYPDEETVATTLVLGSVVISTESAKEKTIIPGQQYSYNRTEGRASMDMVETDLYTSWIDNRIRMSGTSLLDITNQLQRRYNIHFMFENESTKDVSFTGVIPLNENLHVVLGQLAKVSSVNFDVENDQVVIRSRP